MTRRSAALCAALLLQSSAPAWAVNDAPLLAADDPSKSSDFNSYPRDGGQQQGQATADDLKRREEELRRREDELRRAEQKKRDEEEQRKKDEEKKEEEKKEEEKKEEKKSDKPEPELNIPIRYFVWTAIFGGLGAVTGILSAGPERDLRDPAKHDAGFSTWWTFVRAHWGGFISKGFYAASGAMGGYAGYKTQGAIREYLTAKAGLAQQTAGSNSEAFATTEPAPSVPLLIEEEPPPFLVSPFGIQLRF